MEKKHNLLLDVHETPTPGKWILLSLQHVFAMFGATILVPIVINGLAGAEVIPIPLALIASGMGTLIYVLCTKRKSPLYLGSSFAFIAPVVAGYVLAGRAGVFTGIIVVGIIYLIFALFVNLSGKQWIDKLLPPIIIGPMIMIIGLSLAGVAINNLGIGEGTPLAWQNLTVGGTAFIVTVIVAIYAKGFLKIIPFLAGMIAGYIIAVFLGMIDWTPVVNAHFFAIPNFYLAFKDWVPNFGAALTLAPVALVCICEHIGDHKVMSNIINKDLLKDPGLDRTLLGDGLATVAAGLIGGPGSTSYGENLAVVGMSRVASVKVIIGAACFAIAFGFLGFLPAIFSTIPMAVLGGISIILYGFIGVSGLKILIKNQTDFDNMKNIIVSATMLTIGVGGAVISVVSGNFSLSIGGMSLAAIVGIILNLILLDPEKKEVNQEKEILEIDNT